MRCRALACFTPVPDGRAMCDRHWSQLTPRLRGELAEAFRTPAWAAVLNCCRVYLAAAEGLMSPKAALVVLRRWERGRGLG